MALNKRTKLNLFIGFFLTTITSILMITKIPILESIDEKIYDYNFKKRDVINPPENILIAVIDQKGIEKIGGWSWKGDRFAELIMTMKDAGAKVIVFDTPFIFREYENTNMLIDIIEKSGNVIIPILFDFNKDRNLQDVDISTLKENAFMHIIGHENFKSSKSFSAKGIMLPFLGNERKKIPFGHVNMLVEKDGVSRKEPLVIEYNGIFYPSITLQAVIQYLNIPKDKIILNLSGGIQIGERYIPTDEMGRLLINYYGPEQTFRYLPISDIMEKKIKPEILKGKIVLIKSDIFGINEFALTPFSPEIPAVEKRANIIASIIENRFIHSFSQKTNLSILIFSGILFTLLIAELKAIGAIGVLSIFFLLLFYCGNYLFEHAGIWMNTTYPSFNIFLIFFLVSSLGYLSEEIYVRRIRSILSSYMSEKVVNELINNPDMLKVGMKKKEVTILFADLRDFTTFAERYQPEEVFSLLNDYLQTMTDIIFRWDGTIDKFIGDTVVAFWGDPLEQKNHAELAVKCSLHMVQRIRELQKKWISENKPPLDISIGISTGEVLVGNIGREGKKVEYTIIGDNVNLCARLENLTRKYNAYILITELTKNKIEEVINSNHIAHIFIKGLENVKVKGKEKSIKIYEVLSLEHGKESLIVTNNNEKITVFNEK